MLPARPRLHGQLQVLQLALSHTAVKWHLCCQSLHSVQVKLVLSGPKAHRLQYLQQGLEEIKTCTHFYLPFLMWIILSKYLNYLLMAINE